MNSLHDRDAISWRAEWIALPEINLYLAAQLATLGRVLSGLEVNTDRMRTNLDALGGLLMSEHVMFQLGAFVGKQTAHHIVYEAAMRSEEEGISFEDVLSGDPRITEHVERATIESWLDPSSYIGEAGASVDRVVAAAEEAGIQ